MNLLRVLIVSFIIVSALITNSYSINKNTEVLIDDAIALEKSGAFSIVLELIPSELSKQITKSIDIPTIGIGAGINCDGQVQVLHDILGLNPNFIPKHSKKYANLSEIIINALKNYDADIKKNKFPNTTNSFFTNK